MRKVPRKALYAATAGAAVVMRAGTLLVGQGSRAVLNAESCTNPAASRRFVAAPRRGPANSAPRMLG